MTPVYLNSSYASEYRQDEDQINNFHQFLSPNSQASPSSNSLTCHLFLNPTAQQEGENYGSQAYDDHRIATNDEKVSTNGDRKFSLWKSDMNNMNDQNQVKWMSSKMRVMLKMKKSHDPMEINTFSSTTREVRKFEDHKSPMEETDNSSNSTSSNNIPIRVCSDCNTTKTPLWRSGPRGPKSLCNACGIRQRKARRAMAAAAAAAAAGHGTTDKPIMAPFKITKTQHKTYKKPSNGHVTKHKKRQYSKQITTTPSPSPSPSPSSSPPTSKNRVEDFLVTLSKNLPFYQVFPQDEKEAAILLMALSCGYVHE